jgi:hypothetical protein
MIRFSGLNLKKFCFRGDAMTALFRLVYGKWHDVARVWQQQIECAGERREALFDHMAAARKVLS